MHQELRAQGIRTGRRQIECLMREERLRARPKRRLVRTTDSAHPQPVAANHLDRQFCVEEVAGVDRVWVGDIT